MSNKREREKRREERLQEEEQATSTDRRTRLLQLGAGAVFLAIVAVVVLIVIQASGGDSGGDTKLEEVASVDSLIGDIPQEELILGDQKAPVELIEYGDLQCPVCKQYAEQVLPPIIEGQVKQGQAKIVFHNFTIIGPQSIPAGTAAMAAGKQKRGWNYLEVFYHNQGKENSGYADDQFLEAVAKAAGVKNLAKWNEERHDPKLKKELDAQTQQAQKYGFTGTPSFAIKGPGSNGIELLGTPGSTESIEEAIEKAS
jgi:protein-disulfide isomerase